jgi:O-antigen ligase/polysaccharide polymerase Wzy-like membrane protein
MRKYLDMLASPVPAQRIAWVWVFLAVAIAAPFPAFGWPLPERGVPIMWLMLGGVSTLVALVCRVSIPFAALIGWSILRAGYHGFPERSLKVLLLVVMVAMLYVVARETSDRIARMVAVGFCIGAAWEGLLGLVNAFGVYPWMTMVIAEHVGKPMGFLTHPNYYGSFMALLLPIVWSVAGIPAAALVYLLILKTVSVTPVLTASVAILVMAWPLFSRRIRYATAGLGLAGVLGTLFLHEFRLSGRSEVWKLAVPEILRWPVMGQGLGQWRQWAEDWDKVNYLPQQGKTFLVTLQAHNEPYQLLFELGLIGVILGALWVAQAGLAAFRVWKAAPAALLPSEWYAWGRAPLERAWIAVVAAALVNSLGSPVFHLPGQAAIIIFALARMQADADALTPSAQEPTEERSRHHARSSR